MTELFDDRIKENSTLKVTAGDGFVQGIITNFFKVDNEIVPEETRIGGFGSTDQGSEQK